jgi:hypothetical protein
MKLASTPAGVEYKALLRLPMDFYSTPQGLVIEVSLLPRASHGAIHIEPFGLWFFIMPVPAYWF